MNRQPHEHPSPGGVVCSDDDIRREVTERLKQATGLDSRNISIEVQDSGVTLTGQVPDEHTRHAIEELVAACPGVQDVENRIRVLRS